MEAKNFAVGQTWKTRDGQQLKITDVSTSVDIDYPVIAASMDGVDRNCFTMEGRYFRGEDAQEFHLDLVEQVPDEEAAEEEERKALLEAQRVTDAREFADRLMLALASNPGVANFPDIMTPDAIVHYTQSLLDMRKTLQF
jgi:hypothetical protein